MPLREDTRVPTAHHAAVATTRHGIPALVHLTAALLAAGFAATSALVAVLPEFDFESQFPVLLPFFAWAAAAGVAPLTAMGSGMLEQWRAAFGVVSVVPYAALMMTSAVLPSVRLPWWLAPIVGVAAAVPFLVAAARARGVRRSTPRTPPDEKVGRGTLLVSVGLMLMAYAVAGPDMTGSIIAVGVAVALALGGLLPDGLAHAARTWRLRHWVALAWGTLVVWATLVVASVTPLMGNVPFALVAVLAAGLPLVLVDSADTRRSRAQA